MLRRPLRRIAVLLSFPAPVTVKGVGEWTTNPAVLVESTVAAIGTVLARLQKGRGTVTYRALARHGPAAGRGARQQETTAATSVRPSPFTAPPVVTVGISAHPVIVTVR